MSERQSVIERMMNDDCVSGSGCIRQKERERVLERNRANLADGQKELKNNII